MTSPARTSAFRALLTYRKTGQVSGLQCRQSVDRHLAERIVYGVLQNERYLDFCLAQFITRGFRRLHPAALDLLRLSAYQILFLDRIPNRKRCGFHLPGRQLFSPCRFCECCSETALRKQRACTVPERSAFRTIQPSRLDGFQAD